MQKKRLARFIEQTEAFDKPSKLKLLLLLAGVKPSTYAQLKIKKNLHDKHHFEELLEQNKILFDASRAKGFEEITEIKNNAAVWRMKGQWHGYDLFSTKQYAQRFLQYKQLLKKGKHDEADKLAGIIYGYPKCCIQRFITEQNPKKIAKNYTYYEYYKQLHDMDALFPFVTHTPCSPKCKETKKLNAKYKNAVKKISPAFYKEYTRKKKYYVPVIVDAENEIPKIWKQKDGHDYTYITKRPINGKHVLFSWLTKAKFERGTVLDAEITIQYDYATLKIKKKMGKLNKFHHERHFTKL